MTHRMLAGLALLALAPLAPVTAAHAQTVDELKQLVQSEQHQKAYKLGQEMVGSYGQVEFDLYFGVAAVASGNAAEGIMALERVVLQEPDNRTARHFLARGYYALGDDVRARQEFESLLTDADGAEAKTINTYLDALREREASYRTRITALAEFSLGKDSNVNSGVQAGASIYLPKPIYTEFAAPDDNSSSTAISDRFTQIGAGAAITHPLSAGTSAQANLSLQDRRHGDSANEQYDQRNTGLSIGISTLSDESLYRFALGTSSSTLGGASYAKTAGVVAEWSRRKDPQHQFAVSLSSANVTYDDIEIFETKDHAAPKIAVKSSDRDARLTTLALRWENAWRGRWQPIVGASWSFTADTNAKSNDHLSRNVLGWRLDVTVRPLPALSGGIAFGYQAAVHKEGLTEESERRKDFLSTMDLFADYAINKSWNVRTEFNRFEQDSNYGVYDYERNQFLVKVQYQYK